MITFQSVSKRYKGCKDYAVKDISFTVEDGAFSFLVGPSGSGKSTLIKLLSAEEKVTSGEIQVNDYKLSSLRRGKIPFYRRTLGIVFQDFRLIDSMSIEDNLAFVMRVIGIDTWFISSRIDEVLELVDLRNVRKRRPRELSGGEQQRVAIARALINRPAVVLADEPTGNLDPELSLEIMKLFMRVNEELKTTVLVVTHEHELVRRLERRVIFLDHGRVTGDEPAGKFCSKGAPQTCTLSGRD